MSLAFADRRPAHFYNKIELCGRKGVSSVQLRFCSILIFSALLVAQTGNRTQTKPQQSAVTIHVFKSGLFSGFAHNHVVLAPIGGASMDPEGFKGEVSFATKDMKVTDPDVSDKDRAEIQSTMLGPKVLDAEKYPEVRF